MDTVYIFLNTKFIFHSYQSTSLKSDDQGTKCPQYYTVKCKLITIRKRFL